MKTFAKEMWYLLVFAAALITFNVGLEAFYNAWQQYSSGDTMLKTALFMTAVQVGLGMLALKTFEWLYQTAYETRGKKLFKETLDKCGEELIERQQAVEAKLIEYAAANENLSKANVELNDALDRANNTIELLVNEQNRNPEENRHFDDWALDQFIVQMRAKLARKREEEYAGWNDCALDLLGDRLVEQVESLNVRHIDMIDTANFAMFLWVRDAFPAECAEQDPDAIDLPSAR